MSTSSLCKKNLHNLPFAPYMIIFCRLNHFHRSSMHFKIQYLYLTTRYFPKIIPTASSFANIGHKGQTSHSSATFVSMVGETESEQE